MESVLNQIRVHATETEISLAPHVNRIWLVSDRHITETSSYKSDPKFPPNIIIVKMGEIWGRNQNEKREKNFDISP